MAQLNGVLGADRARRDASMGQLRSAVANLYGSPADMPDGSADIIPIRSQQPQQTQQGFVPMPSRTTHGGGFGPAVRARLRAEAMGRRR
ncbi:MAG: hypothetical protein WCP53_12840 [Verrucomicrobiota bacterium]